MRKLVFHVALIVVLVVLSISSPPSILVQAQGLNPIQPSWLPDGSGVVFGSDHSGYTQLQVVMLDNAVIQPIDEFRGNMYDADVFPRGNLVVFTSNANDARFRLYIYSIDGTTQFDTGVEGLAPQWSPNGYSIVYTGHDGHDTEIYITDSLGMNSRQITFNEEDDYSPTWSPSGEELAYQRRTAPSLSGSSEIFITTIDTGQERQVTFNTIYEGDLEWSPLGDQFVFAGGVPSEPEEIFTVDVSGNNLTQLTSDTHGNRDPTWSPDGTRILYSSSSSDGPGQHALVVMNADGSNPQIIAAPA